MANSDTTTFKVWEGIYDAFPPDVSGAAFENGAVLDRWTQKLDQAIAAVDAGSPVEDVSLSHEYPVIPLLAFLAAQRDVRVLDFGGGLGQTYVSVCAASPHHRRIDYCVVEFDELARRGAEVFRKSGRASSVSPGQPRFFTSLADAPNTFDVVHFGAAFQYIDDWRRFLDSVARMTPEYISFGNLLAGDITPFVTFQNYWGRKIPVRFHNFKEVMAKLGELGYAVILDTFHCHRILGEFRALPTEHFPEERRLRYGRDVILKRTAKGDR